MPQSAILLIDQSRIGHARIQECLAQHGLSRAYTNLNNRLGFEANGMPCWYVRHGANTLDADNKALLDLGLGMPPVPTGSVRFDDASDRRCQDLLATHADRPWMVSWSGGVDSTVIVSSLYRNLSAADRERVTVVCSWSSIAENPWFYRDIILPNFAVQDALDYDHDWHLDHSYLMVGEPGDQIFSHWCTRWLYQDQLGWKPWRQHQHRIMEIIQHRSSPALASWLWQATTDNIESCDAPVETVFDWWWWVSFNFCWIGALLRLPMHLTPNRSIADWNRGCISWFDSWDYQRWSLANNNRGDKEIANPAQSKHAAKAYIKTVDHNEYYYKFKAKQNSDHLLSWSYQSSPWFALTTDGRRLWLDKDMDEICQLLPAHFNA